MWTPCGATSEKEDAHRTGGSRAEESELRLSDSIATRNTVNHRTPGLPRRSLAAVGFFLSRVSSSSCLGRARPEEAGGLLLFCQRFFSSSSPGKRTARHPSTNNSFARLDNLAAAGSGADGRLNEGRLLILLLVIFLILSLPLAR